MRPLQTQDKVRPSYPSPGRQWFGLLFTVVALVGLDLLTSNGFGFRGQGVLYVLAVIFVTYWSGLRTGLLCGILMVAYLPVAAAIPGSAIYGISDVEGRMLAAVIPLAVIIFTAGLIQNKLRNSAIRAFEAQAATRAAEESLRISEQLRSIVVDASMDAIAAIDTDGHVTLWSKSAESLFGWTAEEIQGKRLSETIIPESFRGDHEAGLQRFRETGDGLIFGQRLELAAIAKDGREFEVELSVVPHSSDGETMFVGFLRDISLQKRLQQQLLTAQRLDSVGQLAGGIAHDFNNVLSVIVGYSELAKQQLPADHPAQADLDEVLAAARRSSDINNQLLAFSRKQVTAPRVVSLNEVIQGIRPMFTSLIKEHIETTFSLAEDLWPVRVDPGQIEQVLTNMAINARDAMPDGGKLMFESRNVSVEPDDQLPVPDLPAGDYATFSVTDTGTGIPLNMLDRIFEPFFTTKEDKGSGLGLASSYGIVKMAGGRIAVYSEPGHGTMFRVYLPRVLDAVGRAEVRPTLAATKGGTETVLVAEDNDQVRAVVAQSLRTFGYNVLVADSGEEALRIAGENREDIQLLVTDLIMPRMSGNELAKRLTSVYPGLRVLFLSGYTEEAVTEKGVAGVAGAFLQKPVLPTDLAAKVRELLDLPAPAQ